MSARVLVLLAIGVGAVSLSGPVMASLSVPALAIAFWRNALATGVLVPTALLTRRAELRRLTRAELVGSVAAGACLAAHFGLWIPSLGMTSVASSTALVCLQVVWVVLWDRIRGVPVPVRTVVGIAVALAGAVLVTGIDLSLSTRALVGDLLAVLGSVAVAAYTLLGARARRTLSTTSYTLLAYGTAAMLLLPAAALSGGDLTGYPADQWALLALVVLTSQLLGHSVFNRLLDTISPTVVSLTLLLEIPGAALVAAALLGQVPSPALVAGLALVLAGMTVVVGSSRAAGGGTPEEAPVG